MTFSNFMMQLFIGLSLAAILFLITSGLNIIFGLLGVVHFTHAVFYMFGAYIAFSIGRATGNYLLALVVTTFIVLPVIGALVELVLRKIYKRDHIYQLLLTFGFVLVFEDLATIFWGPYPLSIRLPNYLNFSVNLATIRYPFFHLLLITMAIVLAVILFFILYKTRYGNIIRAAAMNSDMARALGVNVSQVYLLCFAVGAGLAGLSGALAGSFQVMLPGMGMLIIIKAFAVVVIGGKGNLLGAVVGSLIVGMWESFGILIAPQFAMVFLYITMALVLLVKPHGIFGIEGAVRKA